MVYPTAFEDAGHLRGEEQLMACKVDQPTSTHDMGDLHRDLKGSTRMTLFNQNRLQT
jgi:hypothetical protein